jgi:hypothetical protein
VLVTGGLLRFENVAQPIRKQCWGSKRRVPLFTKAYERSGYRADLLRFENEAQLIRKRVQETAGRLSAPAIGRESCALETAVFLFDFAPVL